MMLGSRTFKLCSALAGLICVACSKPDPRVSTLKVSYYAQDSAFVDVTPLRITVGSGTQLHSLRGAEMAIYHPFLVSTEMPLDSAATLPVSIVMLGAANDTAAQARLTLGPVEPATSYSLGISAGGRNPGGTPSRCGARAAVPYVVKGGKAGDSLFISISGSRDGAPC